MVCAITSQLKPPKFIFDIKINVRYFAIFCIYHFGQQYLQNCPKLFCDAVSATSAFNLKLCPNGWSWMVCNQQGYPI